MIRTILFAVLFAKCVPAIGQGAAIQLTKMNVVYCNVENPLSIVAKKIPKENLVLTTGNGAIYIREGALIYCPYHPGRAVVYVWERAAVVGRRLIDSVVYRAQEVQLIADLGGERTGRLKASGLRMQIAPQANYVHFCGRARIESFTITFIRDSQVIAERHHANSTIGCRFSDDSVTARMIAEVMPGDKVCIKDIMICSQVQREVRLNDIIILAE